MAESLAFLGVRLGSAAPSEDEGETVTAFVD